MYCRECGKPLLESDKFCSNCGTPVRKIAPADEAMFRKESTDSPAAPKQTAPLPSFRTEEPEPERQEHGERLIFEAIGDSMKWNTDIFPDRTPKKTEDVDFHWNVSDDEFRNRPSKVLDTKLSTGRSEPSLWSDSSDAEAEKPKSTGLKPSDTNSWDELFEGTKQEDRSTRKAPGVGRNSIEAYWEDMFRRDGADKKEPVERTPHRRSISRDEIERGIGGEGSERLDQNKLEDTMTLSREEMEGVLRGEEEPERLHRKETRENREVAELASLAAAGIGAGPTFVPEGTVAVTLPEDKEPKAPTEKEREITGEELEKELFREMEEPMSEAQKMRKRQTEKIDKFYTFNKKNEEFQKLLDQEYERFKKSREQEPVEDYGADLYKLGDENFFEDFSNEGASQALEMARARQTFFHTDEYAELKRAMEADEKAAEAPEEMPAAEDIPEEVPAEEPAAPEMPEEAPAEEPAPEEPEEEMPAARRERKQKKSLFGRLFGRDTEPLDREELAAAVAAAGLDERVKDESAEEEPVEEMPVEEAPVEEAPVEEPVEEAPVEEEPVEEVPAEEEPVEEVPAEYEPAEEEPVEEVPVEEAPVEEAPVEEEPVEEAPADEEEPITASIVFEPEEEEEPAAPVAEDHFVELVEEEAPAEEAVPEEAPVEAPAEETPQEAAEEEPVAVTASIVYDPETDTQETIVETEPAEPAEEEVPRTTEPTRVYEKGDIPTPTTEEERASAFEENRAAAWDAFFSDDEEVNAGNTFDAENDEEDYDEEGGGGSILTSCLAVILVLLLALIVVRLVLPDSIISVKMDQFIEMILNLFRGNAAADLFNYFK